MSACPRCLDEYEEGVTRCASCGRGLGDGADDLRQSLVGTFHPAVAGRVTALLERRGVPYATDADDDRVAIAVDREWRDELRAELALTWEDVVARLEEDDRRAVVTAGGPQPGWFDAPRDAWIDRQGRIQVEATPDETAAEDARRTLGPVLAGVGLVLLLLSWYTDAGLGLALAGVAALAVGLLLPR